MINYLEKEYLSPNLFLHEEFLEMSYMPKDLLHREQELIILSKIFIKLLETPFSVSRKVLIQGEVGIGKTLITRTFSEMLLRSATIRKINIKYIHINCRKEKTSFNILKQILKNLGLKVPSRGFSPQELLDMLQDYIEINMVSLVLTLDELNNLQSTKFDLIYSLSRLSNFLQHSNLSLIAIVRDITLLRNMDESTISTLQGSIITMKKYTLNQIEEILNQRIMLSLKPGVISEEILHNIAGKIVKSGDIRKGLNIIRNSVKIAETQDHLFVSFEDVLEAVKNQIPSLKDDSLTILNLQQVLIFKTIVQILINTQNRAVPIQEIKDYYIELCNEYDINSLKHTQIWQNLQRLKKLNLITIQVKSEGLRGRKSFCSIEGVPLYIINDRLQKMIDWMK